jgi:hypothetical protein
MGKFLQALTFDQEDHMWDFAKLQQVYATDVKEGLTTQ